MLNNLTKEPMKFSLIDDGPHLFAIMLYVGITFAVFKNALFATTTINLELLMGWLALSFLLSISNRLKNIETLFVSKLQKSPSE